MYLKYASTVLLYIVIAFYIEIIIFFFSIFECCEKRKTSKGRHLALFGFFLAILICH